MSEYIIDETGHKGGEEEMLTLAQENTTLRQQLQFATSELTAAKLVVEAAEAWDTASMWDGTGSIENAAIDIGVAARVLKENLKEYGSQFPGSEEK